MRMRACVRERERDGAWMAVAGHLGHVWMPNNLIWGLAACRDYIRAIHCDCGTTSACVVPFAATWTAFENSLKQ